ncbi:hypothetical protein ARMGADRAFT_1077628 [Armillaria gallica]|uniref:Uncharacterized protein n=1 Tax=Armillaria gallica TaxID=47427 RepID=A0A2H3E462_ARMGA|nr:hypothetical protein ARMGADRAFT_1077628 [Armillaria gallica]
MNALPPDISQDDKSVIFGNLNRNLNRLILQALLHGLYTGIVTVTLWTMFSSPKHMRSIFLCTTIIALYILLTIPFGIDWALLYCAFIEHGNNYYTIFVTLASSGSLETRCNLVISITGSVSTLLVDITIVGHLIDSCRYGKPHNLQIWRCWVLWDRQWRVILVSIVCATAGTVMKAMQILSTNLHNSNDDISKTRFFTIAEIDWSFIYILLTLATSLICTLLIVYRIIRHAPWMSASRKLIEILVESSAMYSISLIVYLILVSKNSESTYYADIISAYVKAIAPTLLVGRVSAYANTISARQKMVAKWENHPPLVGCFRDEDTNNSSGCHCLNDGHKTSSGSSGKEAV